MSHLVSITVELDSMDAVAQALEEMGYDVRREQHTLSAFGWKMNCDLSIKKNGKQLMVGFKQNEDGSITSEADWYGSGINRDKFTKELTQLHAKHKTVNALNKRRWKVGEFVKQADGSLKATARRWG